MDNHQKSRGLNFSTAEEAAYPFELTEFVADRVCAFKNYIPPDDSLPLDGYTHVQAAIQSGKQPRLQQHLISEFVDVEELPVKQVPKNAKFLRDV